MKKILLKTSRVFLVLSFIFSNNLTLLAFAQEKETIVDQNSDTPSDASDSPPDDGQPKKQQIINLLTGEVQAIPTKNLNRIAVANPEIVDISDAKADNVFIAGKKPGQTELFIWDDSGKRDILLRVAGENLETVKTRVQEVLDKSQVKGVMLDENQYEGKLVLYGSIPKEDKSTLDKVMEPYTDKIINLVKEDINDDLIQVDAEIVEIDKSLDKALGFNWSTGTQTQTVDPTTGAVTTKTVYGDALLPTYGEIIPPQTGKIGDYFKIGKFYRGQESALVVQVNALINEGKGRVISKPRLVVKNGKEASFLVGGQIPIKSVSTTGGGSGTVNQNITYQPYGVNMTVTPTIREGKIDLTLSVKVTDIDSSTIVEGSTGTVGFTSREAQTALYLEDKQTIVLAGMIKHSDANNVRKVAFLGDIPILGALFRSRNTPASDTELVIILTPRILKSKQIATKEIVMPSKELGGFKKEFDKDYVKESLKSQPKEEPKPIPIPPSARVKKEETMVPVKAIDTPMMAYMSSVQQRIAGAIAYPYEALEKNWQGMVKIRMRILRDGTLADCDLMQSSGHDVFDSDAINTAKKLAPYMPFSEDMKQQDLVVTVPIVYKQKTSS